MTGPSDVRPLHGRVAVVTGASGQIGSAIATALADAGAAVALGYGTRREPAEQVAERIRSSGGTAASFAVDLSDAALTAGLIDDVERGLGPVDVLAAVAGIDERFDWHEIGAEQFDQTLLINLRAPFLLAQRVLPGMQQRGFGRVLLMSAGAALNGGVLGPHYAASKAGLHGMMHFLAPRVAGDGVTVNALAPGPLDNPGMSDRDKQQAREQIPARRLARPQEVAALAVAVVTNPHVTDQILSIDGGMNPG